MILLFLKRWAELKNSESRQLVFQSRWAVSMWDIISTSPGCRDSASGPQAGMEGSRKEGRNRKRYNNLQHTDGRKGKETSAWKWKEQTTWGSEVEMNCRQLGWAPSAFPSTVFPAGFHSSWVMRTSWWDSGDKQEQSHSHHTQRSRQGPDAVAAHTHCHCRAPGWPRDRVDPRFPPAYLILQPCYVWLSEGCLLLLQFTASPRLEAGEQWETCVDSAHHHGFWFVPTLQHFCHLLPDCLPCWFQA